MMAAGKSKISAVPTNIITGFLGVGKTTAILNLLRKKPANERWAVLVNEFGEIGVDGSIVQGQPGEQPGIFVREVPGGCMCCAAGLPMQVALNQLLSSAKPDRLLVEPTGLGHPKEVLQVLHGSAYRQVLIVERTVTLVNARHLEDARYTDNEIFNQQLEVADVVVANKSDLYQHGDDQKVRAYLESKAIDAELIVTTNGEFDLLTLAGNTRYANSQDEDTSAHHHYHAVSLEPDSLAGTGYVKKENRGDGYYSVGWRFREDIVFRRELLFSFLSGIDAARMKAVMNTQEGVFGYNLVDGALTELQLFGGGQSCIEIISNASDDGWEADLLQCVADRVTD